MKGLFRNKQGSSLLEIVVAIAILGLMVAPVCSSLVLSFRLNADSEELLQSRLLVESTVEQLMAEGVRYEEKAGEYVLVTPDFTPDAEGERPEGITVISHHEPNEDIVKRLWYEITVKAGDVEVKTVVKAAAVPQGGDAS